MATPSSRGPVSRAQEILEMFASIPVSLLRERGLQLLNATRHVTQGRDLPLVEEPDNAVRRDVWKLMVEQIAGAAGTRKPVDAAPPDTDQRPNPGLLRKRSDVGAGG